MLLKPFWEFTSIELKFPTITVTVALPVTVSAAAEITACPGPTPDATPEAFIVATWGLALAQ